MTIVLGNPWESFGTLFGTNLFDSFSSLISSVWDFEFCYLLQFVSNSFSSFRLSVLQMINSFFCISLMLLLEFWGVPTDNSFSWTSLLLKISDEKNYFQFNRLFGSALRIYFNKFFVSSLMEILELNTRLSPSFFIISYRSS